VSIKNKELALKVLSTVNTLHMLLVHQSHKNVSHQPAALSCTVLHMAHVQPKKSLNVQNHFV